MRLPIYGFFCGGDPREFRPDAECCDADELRRHREACRLWDLAEARGETPTPEACPSGWETLPDGTQRHVLRAPYGIGVYFYDDGVDEWPEDGEGAPEPFVPAPGQLAFSFLDDDDRLVGLLHATPNLARQGAAAFMAEATFAAERRGGE